MRRTIGFLPMLAVVALPVFAAPDDVPAKKTTQQFNVATFKVSGMS